MKEINVTNIPNARNIIIPKRIKTIPLNEYIYTAYQHLSTLGARAIYIYLLTYPESNVKIGFDSLVNKKMNISNGTRLNGFTTLVEKGYLTKMTEYDYCFFDNPTFTTTSFIQDDKNPRISRPVQDIIYLLQKNNIDFELENIFSDCCFLDSGHIAYFDFFIQNKYIIEYDGEQHFKPIQHWGGKHQYNKNHQHDLLKNKYCFDNNIPIIRIPYDVEYTIDDLKLETTRFLLTPENEQEYYNRS